MTCTMQAVHPPQTGAMSVPASVTVSYSGQSSFLALQPDSALCPCSLTLTLTLNLTLTRTTPPFPLDNAGPRPRGPRSCGTA